MNQFRTSALLIHGVAWLLFMSFPLLFMSQGGEQTLGIQTLQFSWKYLLFCLVYMFIFYFNTWFLFPRLYITKKYISYGFSVLLLLLLVLLVQPFDRLLGHSKQPKHKQPPPMERPVMEHPSMEHRQPPPEGKHDHQAPPMDKGNFHFDIISLFIFLMVVGLGMALRSIREWQLTEKRAILAEAERANAELSFLKAQINPHFLYNTLNNIYTLSITGHPAAAESIMKLSNIMRYVTDQAESDYVPLQEELDCIGNFIDLQRLRLGKTVTLNYTVEGISAGHIISPLILMTFIENVFKYGLSNHENTQITINIKIEADKILFHTQNRIFEKRQQQQRKSVGISNTKQRLNALYPGKHVLILKSQEDVFTVDLMISS
ncbi:hypothetical protein DBR11_25140 [Pedobacter sp. HMWF019]|uniref:sensor histidine kinase n=1 Tax=Pedobacter sp. HMWF019 TaxID=2056856 RepID=UPI000D383405|nr:sensor histidine kinase [Pedobacter sp. HMWF019]PTS93569.1 hypothetical protein DBR11_25140 [Pedobacter sp. HMWF019]